MDQSKERFNKAAASDVTEGFLQALFNFYVSGYYLDLKKERYYAVGQRAEYNEGYGSENDWCVMDDYIRECIHEEDRPLITRVSRIDYIRERLQKEESYSIEVRDHGTGEERWYRYTTMRGSDPDHAAISFMDVTDQVLQRQELQRLSAELEEQNRQLEENQGKLEESAAEQEAQLEEITALNSQLEQNQAELEASVAEIEEERAMVSEAYGMIEGLSQDYHTIWVVDKETSRMRLIRSSGKSTIQRAVQMGLDEPAFDPAFDNYIGTCVDPEDRERMHRKIAFAEVMRNLTEHPEKLYAVNYLRRDDSGHVGYHQIAFANADTQDGKKQFVYGFRDIDQMVKEEQKQKEELENRLSVIQSAMKAYFAAIYIDLEKDSYLTLKRVQNMEERGFTPQGRAQETLFRLSSPEVCLPEFADALHQFVDLSTLNARLKDTDTVTMQYLGALNGWQQIYFIAGDRDEDGTLKTVMMASRMIHEEKEREFAVLKQISEYNDAMSNAGYGMWHIILKDGEAPRMQANDKMAELLGVDGQDLSEEELYNAWYDRIVAEAIPSVQASVAEMMAGHFSENTYQWIHPTKGTIYVRCGGTAGKLGDGTDYLSGYHADVTDLVWEEQKHNRELEKAKTEAEAANAAKTSFLFNMSHDIRTPMNAIMGFRELLDKHQEDPVKRQDYLNKIQDASTVLLSIINNVLEMARIEKGTLEIDETAWSTEQFNDTLYSVFHVMMEEKGINFTRQIEVQHHYVYCDPTKLREIFINILSNAYKYTNAGGSVDMHLEEIPSDREGWVLYRTTISDTGIGMSEEFLPHIFEEFSREQNTTDAKVEGTGLGMPIVKCLVEMLDGSIEVKSKKGEGTTFVVTIPHKIADKADLVDHAGVEIDPRLFKDKHILLAEDNDLNAEIAMEILAEAGFIVDRAEDGRLCLDMLERAEAGFYDLILMDIQMPNMNGYEATKAIRKLEDQIKADTRIIAMTANAFEEDKREAFRAGMNGHLAKPINVNELMKAIAGNIR